MAILTTIKELKKVYVMCGEVAVTVEPQVFVIILGSCVSVCLWDRRTRVGGMNHFLLPETVNDAKSLNGGIMSTRILIESMIQRMFHVKNLEAQIFGGSNRFFPQSSFLNVHTDN